MPHVLVEKAPAHRSKIQSVTLRNSKKKIIYKGLFIGRSGKGQEFLAELS